MPNYYGPRISTDGIRFLLDSKNQKSWVGSGTSWTNLIDGTSYADNLGNPSWANNIAEITIMLWFEKTAASPEYATHPVNKWNNSYANNASFILYHFGNYGGVYAANDGVLGWYGNTTPQNGTGWGNISYTTAPVTVGRKYHIALQYNKTAGGQMWQNGQKVSGRLGGGTDGLGQTSINSSTSNLYIQDGPVAGAYQRVHQILFYSRELSDEEIIHHYNSTKTIFES